MKWLLIVSTLVLGCEEKPYVPPPCRDIKLGTFSTQVCPHADHVLETKTLRASVCRRKEHNVR